MTRPALLCAALCLALLIAGPLQAQRRLPVLLDTDANNELDDQHAMAYLFFSRTAFNVVGVTVNATYNGGRMEAQMAEAERVMRLCAVAGKIPLLPGANGFYEEVRLQRKDTADGREAVAFIIREAKRRRKEKLVVLAVGKLTNVALALEQEPSIADRIRLVWLGSNYPEQGEYNMDNDIGALNYILTTQVPFEIVTVRYGKPSGTAAVTATRTEIERRMPGLGPLSPPVTGRHGGQFTRFGDYSVGLFRHIDTYDAEGTRALYDMAAAAILKNPSWARASVIPAPLFMEKQWAPQPGNPRTITIWEHFDRDAIMSDFFGSMLQPSKN